MVGRRSAICIIHPFTTHNNCPSIHPSMRLSHIVFSTGMKPSDMIKIVLNIKRVDIWDASYQWWYGLLKGQQFEALIERHLIVKTFEECSIPLGMAL